MLPNDFKLAKTGVFWDTGDCPIPKGISPRKIYENIESALTAMGYVGKLAIAAYSDMEQDPAEEAAGWERGREPILNTSRDSWREVPRGWDSPAEDFNDQSSIFFDVENYMKNIQLGEQSSSTHRIATAVPTLSDYKLAEIGVFWNTGDCPIPKGISPRMIYENIKSALNAMGYVGKLSITAFSGMKQDPADFDSSGITLLLTRDKTDRFYELLYNLTEWAYDHGQGLDRKPFNLMLISKDISEDDLYRNALLFWSARNGNILLAQPQILADRLAQFGIVREFWFWKSLSVGEKPISHRRLSKIHRRSLLQSHIADKIAKRLTRSSTSRPSALVVQSKEKTPVQGKIRVANKSTASTSRHSLAAQSKGKTRVLPSEIRTTKPGSETGDYTNNIMLAESLRI